MKEGTRKRSKQVFIDSESQINIVGRKKAERDKAEIVNKVSEGLKVLDFNRHKVEIIGYC